MENEKLVYLLYRLARDHMPAGELEKLVTEPVPNGFSTSDDPLVGFAVKCVERLGDIDLSKIGPVPKLPGGLERIDKSMLTNAFNTLSPLSESQFEDLDKKLAKIIDSRRGKKE